MTTLGYSMPGHRVEAAFISTAVKWGETYVAQQERDNGIDPRSIPVPGAGQFTVKSDEFEKWPGDSLPAVLVLAPGLAGKPRREADGKLTAPVAVGIGIITGSTVPGAAREVAQLLGAAYREMFLTVPFEGLTGIFDSIEYLDERYGDVPGDQEHLKAACRLIFTIWIKGWADTKGSPIDRTTPPADPYGDAPDWPKVESTFSTITTTRRIT